jgi:enoyl-CoA hydratase
MGVHVEIGEQVALVTIDRSDARNALDLVSAEQLIEAFYALDRNADVGAVILTGAGHHAFSAGADIKELRMRGRDQALAAVTSTAADLIERCSKPVIAAVNGDAIGGGCELALACDIRIAADSARFGQPELTLGVVPAAGGTQRLPRIVGLGRAKQLVLLGELIDAATALAWGLVADVVPQPALMTSARHAAARLLERGPLAVRLAKLLLNASARTGLEAGAVLETLAQAICFESTDKAEGISAFLEKRAPRFRP